MDPNGRPASTHSNISLIWKSLNYLSPASSLWLCAPQLCKKESMLKEKLHRFLSPTLLKDRSLPDNTSSPVRSERRSSECSFNLCFSPLQPRHRRIRGTDISNLSDSQGFFFLWKKMHLLLLFKVVWEELLFSSQKLNSNSTLLAGNQFWQKTSEHSHVISPQM